MLEVFTMNKQLKVSVASIAMGLTLLSFTPIHAVNSNSWINKDKCWTYQENGTKIVNCWKKINGNWYRFDENGYMKVGWFFDEQYKGWYYLKADGAMRTGWLKSGTKWFFLNESGKMVKGWYKYNNSWYYFDDKLNGGAMRSNSWIEGFDITKISLVDVFKNTENLKYYYVDKTGRFIDGKKFTGHNGVWREDSFIQPDGSKIVGPGIIDGKLLLFPEGKLNKGYLSNPLNDDLVFSDSNGEVKFVEKMKLNDKNEMVTKNGDLIKYNSESGAITILKSGK